MPRYSADVGKDTTRRGKQQKWHYLEPGGDENVVLLQFLNCLIFGRNSTFNRILQSSTLEFLYLGRSR